MSGFAKSRGAFFDKLLQVVSGGGRVDATAEESIRQKVESTCWESERASQMAQSSIQSMQLYFSNRSQKENPELGAIRILDFDLNRDPPSACGLGPFSDDNLREGIAAPAESIESHATPA